METLFINHYWRKDERARSDHSILYHATDSGSGKDVALKKLITPSLLLAIQKDDAIRSFKNEIEARRAFSHPQVLELHECFEHENEIYLAEELVEGHDLTYYMNSNRYEVELIRGVYIFQKCAEGLYHAHRHGYLHRNLKPENILVSGDGEVKISDFMVCSFLSREQQVRSVLDTDRFENLSSYSAPEVVDGKPLTARSNVFSLGVIMYEFFTGSHPFKGHNEEETYDRLLNHEPFQASELNPRIPPVLNYLIDKCLKKDPQERFAGFRDFLEDVKYLYGEEKGNTARIHLHASRKSGRRLFSIKAGLQRTTSRYRKQVISRASAWIRTLRKSSSPGIFMDDPLESAAVSRKKITRDETPHEGETDGPYTIEPPPGLETPSSLFLTRGSPLEKYRTLFVPAGIAFTLLAVAGILYACYLFGQARGRVTAPSAIVIETQGTSALYVLCTISSAAIEIKSIEGKGDPVKGTRDVNGRGQVQGLAAGTYTVTVEKEGYAPYMGSVTLTEGEQKTMNVELKKGNPALDIVTDPADASIFINDRHIGISPLKAYDLKPGSFLLVAKRDGYKPYSEQITIFAGEVLVRKITLEKSTAHGKPVAVRTSTPSPSPSPSASTAKPPPSRLKIDSLPDVAAVFIDGREAGTTPLSWTVDGTGKKIEIVVKKNGYSDWKDQVELAPGENKSILAELDGGPSSPVPRAGRPFPGGVHPRSKTPLNIKVNANYFSSSAWSKLRGEEIIIDFSREQIDAYLKSLASQQMAEHKEKGGTYDLNVNFSIEVSTRRWGAGSGSPLPETKVVGSFELVNPETQATVMDFVDRESFVCDPESFMYINETNNYNKELHVTRSAPTATAISMIGRNASKIRSAMSMGPR